VQPTTPEQLKSILDATDDTAMNNTVPPSITTPSQPFIPLPTISPTKPATPKSNKSNQGGSKGNSGGGGARSGGGGTSTN
jgi:uncharacterized membrane protein YgcG